MAIVVSEKQLGDLGCPLHSPLLNLLGDLHGFNKRRTTTVLQTEREICKQVALGKLEEANS